MFCLSPVLRNTSFFNISDVVFKEALGVYLLLFLVTRWRKAQLFSFK